MEKLIQKYEFLLTFLRDRLSERPKVKGDNYPYKEEIAWITEFVKDMKEIKGSDNTSHNKAMFALKRKHT